MNGLIRSHRLAHKFHRESGQTLVEFVLVLPLFLVLLFGVIDFGWIAYQKACFDYSRIHASWDFAELNLSDPRYGSYDSKGEVTVTDGVADAVKHAIADAPAMKGFDPNQLSVSEASITLSNTDRDLEVPDRTGAPSSSANGVKSQQVARQAHLKAKVSYGLESLAGFFGPLTVTETVDVTHAVGNQTRTY